MTCGVPSVSWTTSSISAGRDPPGTLKDSCDSLPWRPRHRPLTRGPEPHHSGLGVPTGGSLGWQENRSGLVSYSIEVRGVASPCPALPRATPSPGVVPTFYSEVDYAISTTGVCSVTQVGGHN